MPDVGFWDTAEFQAIGPVLGIAHPTGYPAYTMLAWVASVVLQPFGNEALRANLLSAIFTAAAIGLTATLVTRLTGRFVAGLAIGLALAVSGEVWAIGLRADPHALHLLLATVLLSLLVVWQDRIRAGLAADRWLLAAAVAFGISLANHGLTFLLAPGIAIFVLAVDPGLLRRPRLILACAGALAFTTVLLYAYLPIRSAMNPPMDYGNPQTWDGFRYLVFAEQFRGTFRPLPGFTEALRQIGQETLSQLGIFAILALVGTAVAAWRRPQLLLLLAMWFTVNWYFALGYINADIGRYYLVPLVCVAVLAGLGVGAILDGLAHLVETAKSRLTRWSPGADQLLAILLSTIAAVLLIRVSDQAAHVRYARLDASHDYIARRWLDTVMPRLPQDSVVISWWSYSTTLWYGRYVDHSRPDITVIDDSTIVEQHLGSVSAVIDSYLGERPVYLIRIPYDLAPFDERYVLTPLPGVVGGEIYSVDGMRASGSPAAVGGGEPSL
jgi:hypothetical protein